MRKLLVVLLVLACLAVAGDRVAHKLATDEAARRLATEGVTSPTVHVGGFPFLTQLLARRFGDVRVTGTAVQIGTSLADGVSATARDVEVPSGGQMVVGSLTAHGTIPYAEVLRRVDLSGLRLSAAGSGQLKLKSEVAVLGRTYSVVARGRVEPRGDRLVVTPMSVQRADGAALDDRVAGLLADRFAFSYRVRGLPENLRIDRITPAQDGFAVDVSGHDLRLAELSSAAAVRD